MSSPYSYIDVARRETEGPPEIFLSTRLRYYSNNGHQNDLLWKTTAYQSRHSTPITWILCNPEDTHLPTKMARIQENSPNPIPLQEYIKDFKRAAATIHYWMEQTHGSPELEYALMTLNPSLNTKPSSSQTAQPSGMNKPSKPETCTPFGNRPTIFALPETNVFIQSACGTIRDTFHVVKLLP